MSKIYGIPHTPLMADVRANKRRPDQAVAFIGDQLCFFERGTPVPLIGTTVEVMITRVNYGVYPEGHQYAGRVDHSSLRGLMVQVVEPHRHLLVAIDGFECSGSMCRTTARGVISGGSRAFTSEEVYPSRGRHESNDSLRARSPKSMWLTPGRTDIRIAQNVNTSFYGREPTPVTPTNVWVERAIYEEKSGCGVRVAGLTRIEDGEWSRLVRPAVRKAA